MESQKIREETEDSILRERLVDVSKISVEKAQILCRRLDGRFKCRWGKVFIVFSPSEVDKFDR